MNILILGGDRRMAVAAHELKQKGYDVDTIGLFEGDRGNVKNADVLLFGVPTTRDRKTVFCPETKREIPLDIAKSAKENALLLTCGYKFDNDNCIDYLRLDDFCLLNAVPTAEGAIARAINDTDFTLWSADVLVIGNGRVGRVLAERLAALKCNLTVSARKPSDFALLSAMGVKHIHTDSVAQNAHRFDIIFNTVDVHLFDSFENLKNAYLYDLSSKGCIDFDVAKSHGIRAEKLPAIPGKIAPITAGKIIAQTVIRILDCKR